MVIVGLGSGALVAALPAAAASAAPATQTGVATGLTNSVKTVGGAIASCVFGIALLQGATGAATRGHGRVAGGLLHGVDRLRRDRARRGGRAGVRAEDGVHRSRGRRDAEGAGGSVGGSLRCRCAASGYPARTSRMASMTTCGWSQWMS